MSAMLSRTWNYLHSVATDPSPGWSVPTPDQRHSLPPGLASWLQQVTGCLDKEEEKELCRRQLEVIQAKLGQKGVTPGVMNDCLVRIVYMHLLGYDCSAVYIHCVTMAGSVLSRKMGYLACSIILPPTHQLLLMVTNTILTDLASTSIIDIQLGLVAANNIIQPPLAQLVPILADRAVILATHTSHLVRKKSLILLNHLCQLDTGLWLAGTVSSVVIGCLSDTNPGVAATALQVTASLISDNDSPANTNSAMVAALHLHSQVMEKKLPGDFLYKGHMAPFLRMDIARLLRKLPAAIQKNKTLSDQITSVLTVPLEEGPGDCKDLVVQSLIYETIKTIAILPCCTSLVPLALRHISNFLTSRHHSTVYTGLCGLEDLFSQQPPILTKEQENSIMSCLGHTDPSIKKKTLELLVVLASKDNVVAVVDNILGQVKKQDSDCSQVVDQVAGLVEKFVENLDWRASTMLRVVQVSKDKQREEMTEKLKFLLANPLSEDKDPATELELNRVRNKLKNLLGNIVDNGLKGKAAPVAVTALYIWCEGQFTNIEEDSMELVMDRVVCLGKENLNQVEIVVSCLYAIQKLVTRTGEIFESVEEFLKDCEHHGEDSIKQTAEEVQLVINNTRSKLEPSHIHQQQDWTFSFLDQMVYRSLNEGAKPYIPKSLRLMETSKHMARASSPKLQLTPYNILQQSETPVESRGVSICSQPGLDSPLQVWTLEGRMRQNNKEDKDSEEDTKDLSEDCRLEMALTEDW